jgi:hypothetical protein
MTHPSCTGVRNEQYPHRFRQTLVSGKKTFFEKVITRGSIKYRSFLYMLNSGGSGNTGVFY